LLPPDALRFDSDDPPTASLGLFALARFLVGVAAMAAVGVLPSGSRRGRAPILVTPAQPQLRQLISS
jgi:hypothetical protein